jgi:hypothetical protein
MKFLGCFLDYSVALWFMLVISYKIWGFTSHPENMSGQACMHRLMGFVTLCSVITFVGKQQRTRGARRATPTIFGRYGSSLFAADGPRQTVPTHSFLCHCTSMMHAFFHRLSHSSYILYVFGSSFCVHGRWCELDRPAVTAGTRFATENSLIGPRIKWEENDI